jgi:hypothetical protein
MRMSVFDEVLKHLDGNAVAGIAKQLGASPQQAQSAIQVALPAILGGMQRNIANGGGDALHRAVTKDHQSSDLGSILGSMVGGGGGAGLLGSVLGMMGNAGGQAAPAQASGAGGLLGSVLGMMGGGGGAQSSQSPLASAGLGILKHVLGGSSDRAAGGVAKASGMNAQSSMALMAMLAPMVMGALGKMTQSNNLDASGLAGVIGGDLSRLGGGAQAAPQQKGFLGGLLDADGDGDVDAADLLARGSMLMGLFGKR